MSYSTRLPEFGCRMIKPQKSKCHYCTIKNFFFCVFHTVWTFSHPKMKSYSFSSRSQFNFKNGHFFRIATIQSFCFHWRISKPKPTFLLNQKHQLLKHIAIFIFHIVIVNLMHRQKISSYS